MYFLKTYRMAVASMQLIVLEKRLTERIKFPMEVPGLFSF